MNVRMQNSSRNNAIRALLTGVVDYAGLFPPSKLPMTDAVKNYAKYTTNQYKWMLGRFVVPVTRLDEFLKSSKEFLRDKPDQPWHLSALTGNDIYETMGQIVEFNAEHSAKFVIDSLEVKADSNSEIEFISDAIPRDLLTFCEIPLEGNIGDLIATLAINKRFAKVRMGGVTEDAFPKVAQVMRFMRTCIAANLPFKATAGLHHPVRCFKALSYEKDAPEGMMNGFLNIFLAIAFMKLAFRRSLIKELLLDERAESFIFDNSGVLWRQEYFLSVAQLKELRKFNILSFGSCSFEEPIADLQEIGLL
jgi:hypothetical protein